MRKELRNWLLVAAVTAMVVILGMRTQGTATQAQEKAARPTVMIWQEVKDAGAPKYANVYRAKVPGGWLVLVHHETVRGQRNGEGFGYGIGVGAGVTFVPDPQHTW